jgi:hypothetical protein
MRDLCDDQLMAEAKATLAAINYDPTWSKAEMIAACENISRAECIRVIRALRLIAAANEAEVDDLGGEPHLAAV